MLYVKKRLYNAVMQHALNENITFHQTVVRALLEYTGLECPHEWRSTNTQFWIKFKPMGKFVCAECGLVVEDKHKLPIRKVHIPINPASKPTT